MNIRRTTMIAAASASALVLAGCGDGGSDEGPQTVEPPRTSDQTTTGIPPIAPGAGGYVFGLPDNFEGDDAAFTYDEAAVPVGSSVNIDSDEESGRTTVTFSARGLAPNRDFGVHVHTKRCGPQPSDSGPHYQDRIDPAATPESPSTDPAYANPQNEIWLDVTTDATGNAEAATTVDWEFRDDSAHSLVLHAQRTMTDPGTAGMAGDRLACVDEDF
jgi:superoxide dismutase, Cu-Zn family